MERERECDGGGWDGNVLRGCNTMLCRVVILFASVSH